MEIIRDPKILQQTMLNLREQGKRIALVPTMGNLHAGHISLMTIGKENADICVASIFVNPLQFGPNEDLDSYPRTLQADIEKLEAVEVDYLFAPDEKSLYPLGRDVHTSVEVNRLSDNLCGQSRPGHFRGVTTVVNILFNLAQPHVAVFGKKDYQQLLIIKAMVSDLFMPIEIIGGEIVREENGLAMSSRNGYLSAQEKEQASELRKTILQTAEAIKQGRRDYSLLEKEAKKRLKEYGFKPDYFDILNADNLKPPVEGNRKLLVVAAAWMGKPKLLDNLEVHITT